MTFAQAIAECLPSEDEMLLMAAEAVFPPPSLLDPPETRQGLWDGLAMTKGLLEALPMEEWLAEDNPHRLTPYRVPGVLEALGL